MSLFEKYVPLKESLEQWVSDCQSVFNEIGDTASGSLVSGLISDLENQRYCITIVGSLKRGKSTLLNTLMGRANDDISPISSSVCTSAIIKYLDKDLASEDKREKAIIYFDDPGVQPITVSHSQLRNYVTEENNPENRKQVKSVEVYGDFPAWSKAVTIVDSPGQNSVFGHHDTLLCDFLPSADAIIFLIAADIPLDSGDLALLRELSKEQQRKIFFVLTKIDTLDNPEDLDDVKAHVAGKIAEVGLSCDKLYAVSALPVYQGIRNGLDSYRIEALKNENGVTELERDLERFIVKNSDQTNVLWARSKILIDKAKHALSNYEAETNRLLAKQDFDVNQFKAEQNDLIDANRQLRENTRKALKKFERDWQKVLTGFSRKFASRADAIEDKIRDKLEKGGFVGALFQSFKLKNQVGKAVSMELEPLLLEMESKLEEIISTLNQEFDDEISLYAKRKKGTDFASVGGSFVAATALGGTVACGLSNASMAVQSALTAFSSWQTAGAAATSAAAHNTIGTVGLFPKLWGWLTGCGPGASAAESVASTAADLTNAGTAAVTAGIGAIVTCGISFAATYIVQKILHIGLVSWQSTRVPGMMEKIMSELEEKLFKSLDTYKSNIIQDYKQNVEDIISDRKERISEIQDLLVENDPQKRQLAMARLNKVKQLLDRCSSISKQLLLMQ